MALRKFTPDPDVFDPNDPEGWIGTWDHDDGSSLYGQGDAELGQSLMGGEDQRLAMNAGEQDPSEPPLDFDDPSREVSDAPAPVLPGGPPPMIARPPEQQAAPAAPAPAMPVAPPAAASGAAWDEDVPPQVSNALRQQATAAGLNPDALAAVIKHESGWDPSIGSKGDAGKDRHAGLIQFSEKLWPGVAAAAGQPDVTFDQMRAMSADEQMPFVVAYYKGKGLTPESTEGDYRLATYKPAHLKEGDDFVLDDASSTKGIGVTPKNAKLDRNGDGIINSYEQNAGLDTDKDGFIKAGEVRRGPSGMGGAPRAGAVAGVPGAAGAVPGAAGMPGTYGGLPMSEVSMQGAPQTPEQLAAARANVSGRYGAVMGAHQQAEELRASGARDAMALVEKNHAEQTANREAEIQRRTAAVAEAQQMVDRDVNAPIKEIDPKQYIKNMSTGDKILGAIAVVISAIGQAANSMIGIQGGNTALQILQGQIEQNIDKQKEALARGDRQTSARLAHWRQKLGDEESAINALRGEQKMAAASMLQSRAQTQLTDANQKAQGLEYAATMFAEGQAEIQKITDRNAERIVAKYAPPTAVKADPDKLVKTLQAAKEARQELKATGEYTDEQIDQILAANGLPTAASRGETVPQQATRQKEERGQDEETSKELEPLSIAEKGWTDTLSALDAIAKRPMVTDTSEPERMTPGTWAGSASTEELHGFKQVLNDTINAQIRAEKGNQTPEDIERIREAIVGDGSIADIRRGIANQRARLELQRKTLSTRRGDSAQRLNQRLQTEGPRPVTAPVYIQGQGPRR